MNYVKKYPITGTAWEVYVFGIILVQIFLRSDWIRRDTKCISVFILNGKNTDQNNSEYRQLLRSEGWVIKDWHSRKSSNDSLCFCEELYKLFHIMLPNEKNPGNLVCSIEILLLLKFIWLEAFYNEEFSILYTIQSTGVVFKSVLGCQPRKSFAHYKMSDNARNVKSVAEILWCTRTFLQVRSWTKVGRKGLMRAQL